MGTKGCSTAWEGLCVEAGMPWHPSMWCLKNSTEKAASFSRANTLLQTLPMKQKAPIISRRLRKLYLNDLLSHA